MVKIDAKRSVSDWCLAGELFRTLPSGVYYLTLVTEWAGPKELPSQIALIKEYPDGRLSGMSIESPTSEEGLRSFTESSGFQPTDSTRKVFVLNKK